MSDEGEYFEAGDEDRLIELRGIIEQAMDILEDALESGEDWWMDVSDAPPDPGDLDLRRN